MRRFSLIAVLLFLTVILGSISTVWVDGAEAATIGNEYITANVGSDGRYNFGLRQTGTSNWYNISYAWPWSPGTSFTTVRVDGHDSIYGSNGFAQSPQNVDNLTNESLWREGDISVRQVLQVVYNSATGNSDVVGLRYVLTNTGTTSHEVGLRTMIDTMLQDNDGAPFRIPGPEGMESVITERNYEGMNVPDFWQAFKDLSDPSIAAQWTLQGSDAIAPDRLAIAYWGSIYETQWDYTINSSRSVTGDSAVGMWWNPQTLAPGETRTIVTYYGQPRAGGTRTLTVSAPSQLPHSEWSTRPFNVVAYLNNNTNDTFQNVFLTVNSDLKLPDNDSNHQVGDVSPGRSTQTTWQVQPPIPGVYTVRINAYQEVEGVPQLIDTYETRFEALEPPIPENVQLGGTIGTEADGTPMAQRGSPLTVTTSFNDPQPVSVTLEARDDDGSIYTAEMTVSSNLWSHTFIPSQVGLWENPLTTTIIPHYADGSSGTAQSFEIELIDPSGFIYNSAKGEDWRLPGATVILQYYDPALETWVNMNNAAYPGRLLPVENPQTTGSDGRYGWDVATGQYRVVVSKPGFADAISTAVNVPPPVTTLNVGLSPTDFEVPTVSHTGANDGATYSSPVAVQINAVDASAGIRYLAYSVDGGTEVIVEGTNALVNVSNNGSHTINYRAVDHAGNEATGHISFTINPSSPTTPTLNWSGLLSGTTQSNPANVNADAYLDIAFAWSQQLDRTVSVRMRNNRTGSLIAGYTYGAGITFENGIYHQIFNPSTYNVQSGTTLKVMVYFGNKLKGTTYVNVN